MARKPRLIGSGAQTRPASLWEQIEADLKSGKPRITKRAMKRARQLRERWSSQLATDVQLALLAAQGWVPTDGLVPTMLEASREISKRARKRSVFDLLEILEEDFEAFMETVSGNGGKK